MYDEAPAQYAPCSPAQPRRVRLSLIIFAGTGAIVTIVNLGPESAAPQLRSPGKYYDKHTVLLL